MNECATRRRFLLTLAAAAAASSAIPGTAWAAKSAKDGTAAARTLAAPLVTKSHPSTVVRSISLLQPYTGERLRAIYWEKEGYIPEVLQAFNKIMRDHETEAVVVPDPRLLDQLHDLRLSLDVSDPFHVLSGYRSKEHQLELQAQGVRTTLKSYHVQGRAVDVRVPDKSLTIVRKAALQLKAGGVGAYGRQDFLHLDTGPVRTWG